MYVCYLKSFKRASKTGTQTEIDISYCHFSIVFNLQQSNWLSAGGYSMRQLPTQSGNAAWTLALTKDAFITAFLQFFFRSAGATSAIDINCAFVHWPDRKKGRVGAQKNAQMHRYPLTGMHTYTFTRANRKFNQIIFLLKNFLFFSTFTSIMGTKWIE